MVNGGSDVLRQAITACRSAFAYVGVFSLGINLLMLASPLYMMQVYDRVLATQHVDTLILLTLITAAALLTFAGLEAVRSYIVIRLARWLDERLSGPILAGAVADALHAGRTSSAQGLRDLGTLRGFLAGPMLFPLFDLPWAPLFLLIVFLMHPVLGWVSLIGAVLLFLLAIGNELLTRKRLQQANARSIQAFNDADAAVRNADVIAAMGMLPAVIRRWQAGTAAVNADQTIASDHAALVTAAAKFVRIALQTAILAAGAYLVIQHEITGGVMIASSIIMGRAVAPAEQAMGTWKSLISAQAAYRRLCALLERAPTGAPGTSLPRPRGELVADRVTFTVPGGRDPILKAVSFAAAPSESIALIGPSGSGKTTLARLIVGSLRASAGAVRLDGADVSAWDAADRGQYVGYLPQDVELFNGTVRENIARFTEAADEEVVAAAQLAGAHDLILGLPQGYDTRIGAGGVPLSGGQRQRVGLARAVFRMPRLVVLDEPNANLDAPGEQALVEAIQRLRAGGATLILVTQRMGILGQMDKILALRGGAVEAFGPRDEILARLRGLQQSGGRGPMRPVFVAGGGTGVEGRTG